MTPGAHPAGDNCGWNNLRLDVKSSREGFHVTCALFPIVRLSYWGHPDLNGPHYFAPSHVEGDALDLVEAVLSSEGLSFERAEEQEVHFGVSGSWSEMHGFFARRDEPPALSLTIALDMRPQANRRLELVRLLNAINERMWLGHFELWADDGAIVFRHAAPLIDRPCPTPGEIAAMLASAVDSINRFFPAFNFVIWAGKTAEQALEAALFETIGEA